MMTFRGYWALTIGILAGLGSISFASKFLLVMFIFMFTLIILSIINIYIIKSTIHTTRIVLPEKPDEETEILTTLRIKGATADTILKDYFDNGKKNAKFFFNKTSKDAISEAQYKFCAKQRGNFTVGPILISESDWLGFFLKDQTIDNEDILLIYPKTETIPLPSLPLRASDESSYFDSNSSSLSEDLFGLKEYEPGDDIRLIHWKTSSRTRKIFVRQHEPISTRSIAIILDLNENSYDENEFESAIRLCASICQAGLSSSKKTIFIGNDQQEVIYDADIFLDKLCSQQLVKHTVPFNILNSQIKSNQCDSFIITGSRFDTTNIKETIFKVTSKKINEIDGNNVFCLNVKTIFEDYKQWVAKWNVRERSASL